MNFQNQNLHTFRTVTYSDYVNNLRVIDQLNTKLDQEIVGLFLKGFNVRGNIHVDSDYEPFEGQTSYFYFEDEANGNLNFLFKKVTKNIIGPVWIKKITYYT